MSALPPQATPGPADAPREIELKLLLEPADLASLRRHRRVRELALTPARTRRLHSVYFDTPALDLLRQGVALRIRRVGRRFVQTLKLPCASGAGLLERTEIEAPVAGPEPDPHSIPHAELRARVAGAVATPGFGPILETEFQRTERRLRIEETELIFDLDVGEIRTPRGALPICELELELCEGEPTRLYELAVELQRSVRLHMSTRSKFERGLECLTGAHPTPRRAQPLALPPDASLERAMEAAFRSCLDQILANEEPARRGVDPEGVHQMRVGVRRLRCAIGLFRDVLPDSQTRPLREELRWLADELGGARDLDVFCDETLAVLRRRFPDDPQLKRIHDEASHMRAQAYARVRSALDSLRYAELVLRLGLWLAARTWRQQATTPESARLFQPGRQVGRRLLGRRHRKLLRGGPDLSQLGEAELHAVRIDAKKLRFACEFLRSLFPKSRARGFVRRVTRLQNTLGHLNDVAAARSVLGSVLERMGPEAGPQTLRAAGFVEGWISRAAEDELSRLPRRWKAVRRRKPFWKRPEAGD